MESATTDYAVFDETVVFLSYFKDLTDPRQQGKVTYPLDDVLLLCLLAVPAGSKAATSSQGPQCPFQPVDRPKRTVSFRPGSPTQRSRAVPATGALPPPAPRPSRAAGLLPTPPKPRQNRRAAAPSHLNTLVS